LGVPLVTALADGTRSQTEPGLETEVIVEENARELIQCQKTQRHNDKAHNISPLEP
jgi:hypothetical protein